MSHETRTVKQIDGRTGSDIFSDNQKSQNILGSDLPILFFDQYFRERKKYDRVRSKFPFWRTIFEILKKTLAERKGLLYSNAEIFLHLFLGFICSSYSLFIVHDIFFASFQLNF